MTKPRKLHIVPRSSGYPEPIPPLKRKSQEPEQKLSEETKRRLIFVAVMNT